MPARRPSRKAAPEPPDLPDDLEPAPGALRARSRWVGVRADRSVEAEQSAPDVELRETVWAGADLSGRRLTGLTCRDVRFEHCDLSGAVLDEATLHRVVFAGCRMTGTVVTGAQLRDVRIENCQADLTNWRMSRAEYLLVVETSLREADFYATSLTATGLLDCDLSRASFRDCELSDVDLHGSTLEDIRRALALSGARIAADQILPLAVAVLAEAGIEVSDGPAPGRR